MDARKVNRRLALVLVGAFLIVLAGFWLVSRLAFATDRFDDQIDLPATWTSSNLVPVQERISVTLLVDGTAQMNFAMDDEGRCVRLADGYSTDGKWTVSSGNVMIEAGSSDVEWVPARGHLGSVDWSRITTLSCEGRTITVSAF